MSGCTRSDCDGSIASDGYCDTCGYAGQAPAAAQSAAPPATPPKPAPVRSPAAPRTTPPPPVGPPGSVGPGVAPPPVAAIHQPAPSGESCTDPQCFGNVAGDGYCDTCGLAPSEAPEPAAASSTATARSTSIAAPVAPDISTRVSSGAGNSATERTRTIRSTSTRAELGAGLVRIVPTFAGDPALAVMDEQQVAGVLGEKPEDERFCSKCGQPVGRGEDDRPGRVKGFCGNCRTQFDFHTNLPQLRAGQLVGGQYRILGPLAHGGMGWIYLGQDTAVSNRWVVLKGLLNEEDEDAVASAVAERQFLARIEHGSIVNIYNFVTWEGAGYIVMEYVGGESLNQKLKERRKKNLGTPDPLPITEAIAYVLGILPALGYLHDQALVYNDLKPANIMAVNDGVKLIDVGGVMLATDHDAAIFGTQGFQAPEVATMGPSIASDLFTVGRTLAVLSLNFVFHAGDYQFKLPSIDEQPLFQQYESLYRFLLTATAAHPDDRFQTANEMAEQLLGVLREIVARQTKTPRPSTSPTFGPDQLPALLLVEHTDEFADFRTLPAPKTEPDDPGAAYLNDLPELDPQQTLELIEAGVTNGAVPDSVGVRLRRAREMIDAGHDATQMLLSVQQTDPWNWQITWFRGVQHLRDNNPAAAADAFSIVWTILPGELAPKLATAFAAEAAGAYSRAAQLYSEVVAVDSSYVSAAFGLARCRVAEGDRQGAVDAYGAVPTSSATYTDAQVATALVLTQYVEDVPLKPVDVVRASNTIEGARIDSVERTKLAVEVMERALSGIEDGGITESPEVSVFGNPLTTNGLRTSLEAAYREMGKLVASDAERFAYIDKANAVRVPSLR